MISPWFESVLRNMDSRYSRDNESVIVQIAINCQLPAAMVLQRDAEGMKYVLE